MSADAEYVAGSNPACRSKLSLTRPTRKGITKNKQQQQINMHPILEELLNNMQADIERKYGNPAAHIPVIKNCPCLNCSVKRYIKEKEGITLAECEELEKGRVAYENVSESLNSFRKAELEGFMSQHDSESHEELQRISLSQTCEAAAVTAEKLGRVKVSAACRALGKFSAEFLPVVQSAHDELKAAFKQAESERQQSSEDSGD